MPGRMVAVTGQSPSPHVPQGQSVLEAVLERITYANEDTGYTIVRVATERTGPDLLTVVGPLLGAQVGESLRLLRRNLLYTGVTRARKLIILARSHRALAQAVRTPGAGRRHTALTHRLHPAG